MKVIKFLWQRMLVPILAVIYIACYLVSMRGLNWVSTRYNYLLLAMLVIFLIPIVISEISGFIKANKKEAENPDENATKASFSDVLKANGKQIGYVAVSVLYLILMNVLGYYVSTAMFVFVLARMLGVKKLPYLVLLSFAVVLAVFLMLNFWLGINMPQGLLI